MYKKDYKQDGNLRQVYDNISICWQESTLLVAAVVSGLLAAVELLFSDDAACKLAGFMKTSHSRKCKYCRVELLTLCVVPHVQ